MIFSGVKEDWRADSLHEGVVLIAVFALFIYGISYSLGYGGEVLNDVPIAVVIGDESAISRRLVRMFDASQQLQVAHEVVDM